MLSNSNESPLGYWSAVILGLIALTFAEVRVLRLIGNEQTGYVQSLAVTEGEAEWKAYQNRVAGPYTILLVSRLTGWSYEKSYLSVTEWLLLAGNACAFVLVKRRERSSSAAWCAAFANAALFVVFQDKSHVYIWDFIDAVTFLFFAYGMITGASLSLFVPLFLVEVMNREAAQFIALGIILLAVVDLVPPVSGRTIGRSIGRIAVGGALLAFSSWWVSFLRNSLLRIPPGEEVKKVNQLWGQHYQLPRNLKDMQPPLDLNSMLVWLILLLLGVLFALAVPVLGRRAVALGLLLAAMLVATLLFGLVNESRIWISFIPFLLFLWRVQRAGGIAYAPLAPGKSG